ncbi:MAG: hypothetical protein H6664_11890 [Ardenticatenaceae bacterium]|nr:hypothetical protein [Ardenticatenaceae bacterium]
MNKTSRKYLIALTTAVFLILITTTILMAQTNERYELSWATLSNGGGISTGGNYELIGSIGQPAADLMRGDVYELNGGFLQGDHIFIMPPPSLTRPYVINLHTKYNAHK